MTMIFDGSNGLTMQTWTTTSRPASPVIGQTGFNTTYNGQEVYNGSTWTLINGGPAFHVWLNGTDQAPSSGVSTKITFNTKIFDTNNCYDASTNYRFTPNVPGYYQLNASCDFSDSTSGISRTVLSFYKNGTQYTHGPDVLTNVTWTQTTSCIMYFNGTTDYAEVYGYVTATGPKFTAGYNGIYTWFSGAFVRGQ
jgi:hypothetical protein